MFDLITIGDSMIDAFHLLEDHEIQLVCDLNRADCRLCLTYADKIPVKEIRKMVAGNAANNAIGSARLGFKTAIFTVVGDDISGEMIKSKLIEEGVEPDYILSQRGAESNYSTVLSYQGERTILVYHSKRLFKFPAMQRAHSVYYTSLPKEGHEALTDKLVDYVVQNHSKLIFQPGTFQLRLGAAAARSLLKVTEMIIMNLEEAEDYVGLPSGGDVTKLLAGLQKLGPKISVITDGVKGSYAKQGERSWFLRTRPEINRVEATGAGDAYATGFAAALMLGETIPEAMRWGTLNAEGVIQQIGPQAGLLTRSAMEHQLEKTKGLVAQELSKELRS